MSKIGRKPISITSAKVTIDGNTVKIDGPKAKFIHEIPPAITVTFDDKKLLVGTDNPSNKNKVLWGLHRALLANKIKGAESGFQQKVKIVGLGYKAQLSGKKLTLTLGFTHKIDYDLPEGVTVDIDRTGQQLVVNSSDKFILGNVCDALCSFRPPEPYKGTGVMREGDKIRRKAGKAKSAG